MNGARASELVRRKPVGSGHSYSRRTVDGWVPLDGVTSLLRDGLPKPALVEWAARTVARAAVERWEELGEFPPEMREKALAVAHRSERNAAASKGREVHLLAEELIAGADVDVPEYLAAYVDSAVDFLDAWKIRPLLTETVVYNLSEGYAGTLDMVVTSDLLPGEVILADWKTSGSGIYNEAALQLAAYRHAEGYVADDGDRPFADLGVTRAWGVWIRDDGWDVFPLETGPEEFETFLSVAGVARRARAFDSRKGGRSLVGDVLDRPTLDLAAVLVEEDG